MRWQYCGVAPVVQWPHITPPFAHHGLVNMTWTWPYSTDLISHVFRYRGDSSSSIVIVIVWTKPEYCQNNVIYHLWREHAHGTRAVAASHARRDVSHSAGITNAFVQKLITAKHGPHNILLLCTYRKTFSGRPIYFVRSQYYHII